MLRILKRLFPVIGAACLLSCIQDDGDELCNIYLEFIFDHNMEYADSFDPQVATVDVYFFDESGKFVDHRNADARRHLTDGKRMAVRNELARGTYHVLTLGGLSEYFSFTDLDGRGLIPGITSVEEVKLALVRESDRVSLEFPHLWFGESTTIIHNGDGTVWPVKLVRNTNIFNITVVDMDAATRTDGSDGRNLYTFDITTPEPGVYGYDNTPLEQQAVTFEPYDITRGEGSGNLSSGKLNTMRLFADYREGYRLVLRDPDTFSEIWSYDLISLLRYTKPDTRPDGTALPFQEYLDRQGDWNIVILIRDREPGGDNSFVAVGVVVNDWIIWFNDVEI